MKSISRRVAFGVVHAIADGARRLGVKIFILVSRSSKHGTTQRQFASYLSARGCRENGRRVFVWRFGWCVCAHLDDRRKQRVANSASARTSHVCSIVCADVHYSWRPSLFAWTCWVQFPAFTRLFPPHDATITDGTDRGVVRSPCGCDAHCFVHVNTHAISTHALECANATSTVNARAKTSHADIRAHATKTALSCLLECTTSSL